MSAFWADPALGGDNSTTTDDTNPITGLDNGGHRTRLVPMFVNLVAMMNWFKTFVANALSQIATYNNNAQTAAATAVNAPGTFATTTATLTPQAGTANFLLAQTGKAFGVGQWVMIASAAAPTSKWMLAQISAFTASTGSMSAVTPAGYFTGTAFSDGQVTVSAPPSQSATVTTSRAVNSGGLVTGGGTLAADRTLTVTASTAAQLWAGSDATTTPTPAAHTASLAEQSVAWAASITLNLANGWDWVISGIAGQAITLANPTGVVVGTSGWIRLPHDAAATLAVGSFWKRDGGLPGLTGAAGVTDWLWWVAVSSTQINYTISRNPT